jgi:NhaA family Na+:H+ antiporter
MFPIVGALGGAILPALIYFLINLNGGNVSGWGIPMATDIAFALGILSLLGDKVPLGLKVFLTSLAVADDMIAVLVIAIFYSSSINTTYLIYAVVVIIILIIMNRLKIKIVTAYLLIGAFLWYYLLKSGVHATIAGVLLAFFIPTSPKISFNVFARAAKSALNDFVACKDDPDTEILTKCQKKSMNRLIQISFAAYNPLSRLEYNLHGFSAFIIMPVFAFSNTGITFSSQMFSAITSPESLGIILGLFIGKPLGIFGLIYICLKMKLITMPEGLNLKQIFGASILGGIGLTMSIFIANMAFAGSPTLENAKLAILSSSVLAGIMGFIYLKILFGKTD